MSATDSLSIEVRTQLGRWLDELHIWNGRMNLTTVPPAEAWKRHVEESLVLLAAGSPGPGATVIDIGSGGGVPGLPFAVVRPDLHVTLLDADRRRAGFLTHVTGVLGLGDRVTVVASRAEILGHDPEHRESFDLAVSRATAPAAVLAELALPLVRLGGRLAALVGDAAAAATEASAAVALLGGATPTVAGRGVLVVEKSFHTPAAYPRRDGVPARRPLTGR